MGNALAASPLVAALSAYWGFIVTRGIYQYIIQKPWGMYSQRKRLIAKVQKEREEKFEEFRSRVDTKDEKEVQERTHILSLDLHTLRIALQNDEVTAVRVLRAYMWKALQVHQQLNCCASVYNEAFEIAEQLDEQWHNKKNKPALFGIPFSVKENFHLKGYDCTVGLGKNIDNPMRDECTMVSNLRSLGAVPFVITNVPQALLSYVCSNAIYGTTANPHDHSRTPGGSSGGEAALFAARGSPFGTGSDLAGSLRIPAAACGIVSLKPTEARFVVVNAHGGMPGRGRLGLGYGFFTNNVQEQILLLKQVIGKPSYRTLVPESSRSPLDDDQLSYSGPMRIGYFESDGFIPPVPGMARAVRDTVESLRRAGNEMVAFHVPDVDEAVSLAFKNVLSDGGAYILRSFEADVVDKHLQEFVTMLKLPKCVRWLLGHLLRPFSRQMFLVLHAYVSDLNDLRYTQELTDAYKRKFIEYWKSLEVDALICPSFPVPALPHSYPGKLGPCAFATVLFNMVDFPAGVVPVGKFTAEDDRQLADESIWPTGRNPLLKMIRNAAKGSEGLPATVQVVTLPLEEEKCLNVMRRVESSHS